MNKKLVLLVILFTVLCSLSSISYAMGGTPPTSEVEIIERIATQTEEVAPKEKYVRKAVLDVPWGLRNNKPGELGYEASEGLVIRPERMVVDDKGNIYIFDIVNNRINKYNKFGRFIRDYKVDSFQFRERKNKLPIIVKNDVDIAIDSTGKLCVVNDAKKEIRKLDNKGGIVGKVPAKNFTVWNGRLEPTKVLQEGYITPSGLIIRIKEGESKVDFIRVFNEKGDLVEKLERKITQIGFVDIFNEEGNLIKEVEIKVPYRLSEVRFLGTDKDGNIYIYVEKQIGELFKRQVGATRFWEVRRNGQFVYKYSSKGVLLAEIMLAKNVKNVIPITRKGLFVDKLGNIYLLFIFKDPLPSKERYKVFKWEKML